ncbi:hypothetical protein D3C71_948430 [compost metagenome]
MSTFSSRSGAMARPNARCSAGSSPRRSDSCTTGTSAFGYIAAIGENMPWS